jgi:hypothetical protein
MVPVRLQTRFKKECLMRIFGKVLNVFLSFKTNSTEESDTEAVAIKPPDLFYRT